MLSLFTFIERSAFSIWVRETPSLLGFPFILYLHTLGLAMLAGINVALVFWLLNAQGSIPLARLSGIYRVMWLGFLINALSGLALLAAYPAKALTNWVFFAKLLCVAGALWALEATKTEIAGASGSAALTVSPRARKLALLSLVLWAGTILGGRLLAYTHSVLLVSEGF